MEEARRFLRYILPGLVFIIVVLATLFVADYEKSLWIIGKTDSIGNALGMFVISGGLGYIISNIYFYLYWIVKGHAVNHVDVIKSLNQKILINDINGNDFTQQLNKQNCWVIMNVFWHSRIKKSVELDGINAKNDQITDITHGIGTSVVATLLAMVFCIFLFVTNRVGISCEDYIWIFILWFILIVPSFSQYLRVHNQSQALVNSSFANEVISEGKDSPISITYAE